MSCIYEFQGQIDYEIVSRIKFFPVFPTLSVQNLFSPGRYLPVNTTVKTGYRPKLFHDSISVAVLSVFPRGSGYYWIWIIALKI